MALLEKLFGGRTSRALLSWPGQILDLDSLTQTAQSNAAAYSGAVPFPHAVIDRFIDTKTIAQVAREFPGRDDQDTWLDYNGNDAMGRPLQHRKHHISDEDRLGAVTQRLLYELKSARFLKILSTLTGIEHLIPDALNHGGGLHMNCRGAMLKIHADFSRHPNWHLDRRLNLLLYLNEGWQPRFGGDLELWDADMQACRKRVAPVAGRCVIFSTSSTSFHGHPDPVACSDEVTRKSIALYYYTNSRPSADEPVHSTLWQARPDTEDCLGRRDAVR
jgi:Rps23 Pro-64 3,4-dihydroxylase Tpa1-like proline 4-hydroxylase